MTGATFTARAGIERPEGITGPYTVYVNGVGQTDGVDYREEGGCLTFRAALRQEGRLGFWRWAVMFIGLAGSYGQNDCVDIMFRRAGSTLIETALPNDSLIDDDVVAHDERGGPPIGGTSFDARTGPFLGRVR